MIKSELYSNLKETVELLYELLLPEGSTEVSRKNSEEELELLQNEINALDYSCLDEVYHGGLKEVINDDLSPVENALIYRLYFGAPQWAAESRNCGIGSFTVPKKCTVHSK